MAIPSAQSDRPAAAGIRTWLVSNRLPFRIDAAGAIERSDGGLVSALLPVHQAGDSWWVGQGGFGGGTDLHQRLTAARVLDVAVGADLARAHYNGASNAGIWPLFHYFPAIARFDPDDWSAYRAVNQAFADTLLAQIGPQDRIWIHDYQLMLLPELLRRRRPNLAIGYFHHIPFPASEVLKIHPAREEILSGLLGADVVGFHTLEYARHFAASATRLLGLVNVAEDLHHEDRIIRVGAFPLGIDAAGLAQAMASPGHAAACQRLGEQFKGRRLILGVDRLDYTKGIPERLMAFERLLRQHPEWRERATLVQLCVPSRIEVGRYEQLREEVERAVGRINGEFGSAGHVPIHYLFQRRGLEELCALYRQADVCLVTPLRDGLNLVCKEYVAARADLGGALVLSEFAGAAEEMGEALVVNPYDVEAVAGAIRTALELDPEQGRARMAALRQRVLEADNRDWASRFLQAVDEMQRRNLANASRSLEGQELARQRERMLREGGLVALDADLPGRVERRAGVLARIRDLAISRGATVLFITSMPCQKAEAALAGPGVWLAAERGAFLRPPTGGWSAMPGGEPLGDFRAELRRHLELRARLVPRSYVVENQASIHWHVGRRISALVDSMLRESVHAIDAMLSRSPWHATRTVDGLVVRSGHLHAGSALDAVAERSRLPAGAPVLTIGDRYSDDGLFRWHQEDNCSIAVGTPVSAARYLVANLDELEGVVAELLRSGHA